MKKRFLHIAQTRLFIGVFLFGVFLSGSYTVRAESLNQLSFGGYVADTTSAVNANSELAALYETLAALGPGTPENLKGHDQLSGAIYATTGTVLLQNCAIRNATLAALLRREAVFSPISPTEDDGSISLIPGNESGGTNGANGANFSVESTPSARRYWALGYGIGGGASDDGETPGYTQSSGGTLFGFDWARNTKIAEDGKRPLCGHDTQGLFGSYTESTVASDGLAERATTMELMFGFHSHYESGEGRYSQTIGSLGYGKSHTRRNLTSFDQRAWSDREAFLGSWYSESGRNFHCILGNLQTFYGWQYIGVHQYRFTEKGADAAGLIGKFGTTHSFRSMLGMRMSGDIRRTPYGVLTLNGSAVWWCEWINRTYTLFKGRLAGANESYPDTMFQVKGNDAGRNWGVFGLGLTWDVQNWRLFAGYDAFVNIRQTLHTGNAGLAYTW